MLRKIELLTNASNSNFLISCLAFKGGRLIEEYQKERSAAHYQSLNTPKGARQLGVAVMS